MCDSVRFWNLLLLVGFVMVASTLSAQEFPAVEELPEKPELPDPFVMMDGTRIESKNAWYEKRRPELKALFQQYVYGWMPPAPEMTSRVTNTAKVLDGKVKLKEVELTFPERSGLSMHLALFLPASAEGPVPVFQALNDCGNHTVIPDEAVSIQTDVDYRPDCGPNLEEHRGEKKDFWNVDYLVSRRYGFVTFHEAEVDPDKEDFSDGVHAQYDKEEVPGPPEAQWGTLAAWAWGHHRVVDYLMTDDDVHNDKIAITGHSRRGKAALLAGALDERIALVNPHQSGTGGMALSRFNNQETVKAINRDFPHWFNDVFPKFNDNEAKLPVDQHLLVSLVAPRPLLDTAGFQDTWANYESAWRNLLAADEVYEFLGKRGLVTKRPLTAVDEFTSETAGELAQFRLDKEHTLDRDFWEGILDFADLHLRQGE